MIALTSRDLAMRLLALLAGLASAAVCRAATLPLREVVPEYMRGNLETAIVPTPQHAELKATVFAAGKVAAVFPKSYDAPDTLARELSRLLGAELVSPDDASTVIYVGEAARRHPAARDPRLPAGEDGYVLDAAAAKGRGANVVLLAGNSPAGDFWAFATLRQMVFEKDGTRYVREGRVVDFPRFRFRGNKRPRLWEWRYKANYGWSFQARKPTPRRPEDNFRWDYFRHYGAWIRHGDPLMATDEEMDKLIAGYQTAGKGGKPRQVRGAIDDYKAGCREFVLKFDDTGSKMSPATEAKFGKGSFLKALHHYLLGMHRRLRALDPANRIFFMPRPYYANSFEAGAYARGLRALGPLPDDMGLSVCGTDVISPTIPTGCLRELRQLFGLKAKAQIYDNRGRGGEYSACRGRDADLWKEVDCLFPERGTPVTRITVYDYLWNPEAYDPDRSLRLAVRELSSRKPEVYKPLLDYILTFNACQRLTSYVPRKDALARLRESNRTLKSKYDALAPLLATSPMASEVRLAGELWGTPAPRSSYEWGEYARLRRRLEFEPYMLRYGWQETAVARAAAAPTIDGRLDEAAWAKAPGFEQFARPAWGMKEPPSDVGALALGAEESTRLRLLHTESHLYVGIDFAYRKKPELPNWAAKRWQGVSPGQQAHYAWRVPCFEIFLDVNGKRTDYYQIISNIAGIWLAKHFGAYRPGKVGQAWRPGWTFAFALGETRGGFEAAVPFADLVGKPPGKGDVWGFQCFRSKMGTFGLFSGTCDLVGGNHAPDQFGRIEFR